MIKFIAILFVGNLIALGQTAGIGTVTLTNTTTQVVANILPSGLNCTFSAPAKPQIHIACGAGSSTPSFVQDISSPAAGQYTFGLDTITWNLLVNGKSIGFTVTANTVTQSGNF